MNKYQDIDNEIKEITTELKTTLINNALKIFEENKIIYSDVDKTVTSEFWKEKDVPNYEKAYENYIYKGISLFVIKHLDRERNPTSLYNFVKDSHNIISDLRYFPFANLSKAYLSKAYLSKAILSYTNLSKAILSGAILYGTILLNLKDPRYFQMDNETDFSNALTDDEDFLNSMININRKEKLPVLVKKQN